MKLNFSKIVKTGLKCEFRMKCDKVTALEN